MSNIIRITKAVLASELAAARAKVAQLEVQLVAERAQRVLPLPVVKPPVARILAAKPAMPQWQIDRAVCMAAAKALAQKCNRVVHM